MFGEVPMARTLYRKILDKHVVRAIDANTVLLYVDLQNTRARRRLRASSSEA